MNPYLDSGFLATLLLKASGSTTAWNLVRRFEAPYSLNRLHFLQIEEMLFKGLASAHVQERQAAAHGLGNWRHYLQEGVFRLREENWEDGFRLAVSSNRTSEKSPVSPLFHLHVAIASLAHTTHLLSFRL